MTLINEELYQLSAKELLEHIRIEKEEMVKSGLMRKKTKLPPITQEEIPYELPEGWEWERLGNICYKLTDGSHNPPKGIEGKGYPMLSAVNINKKIDYSKPVRIISEKDFILENKRTDVKKGDILLTIVGTIGRCVVMESDEKITLQRSVAVIKSGINQHYLAYAMQSPFFVKSMYENAKGTAQLGVYLNKLSNLLIAVPSLIEQQGIVEKLDSITALCNRLEEELNETKKQAHNWYQAMLKETCQPEI